MTLAERLHFAACEHQLRARSHAHYYGTKVILSVLVAAALLSPDHLQLPLAMGANMLWLWLEP